MTTAFPLSWPEGWPRTERRQRKPSKFKTRYADAYDNLLGELRLLGASGVVVSSNAPLRRDGRPYTEAMEDNLDEPGVAVYFTLAGSATVMARDGHPTPAENLHAIGHVVAAVRSIDRHGGSFMMRRAFSGFAALPSPAGARRRPWREVLGISGNSSRAEIDAAYRMRAREHHPDAGGSHEAMAELNRARDEAIMEIGNG